MTRVTSTPKVKELIKIRFKKTGKWLSKYLS